MVYKAATMSIFLNTVLGLISSVRLICLRSNDESPLAVCSVAINANVICATDVPLTEIRTSCTHSHPMLLVTLHLYNRGYGLTEFSIHSSQRQTDLTLRYYPLILTILKSQTLACGSTQSERKLKINKIHAKKQALSLNLKGAWLQQNWVFVYYDLNSLGFLMFSCFCFLFKLSVAP